MVEVVDALVVVVVVVVVVTVVPEMDVRTKVIVAVVV